MAELRLGPNELDRLEDALEGLEQLETLDDPSPVVAQRLADFQAILQASREALPMEDVPSGLLDGVLAEARVSSMAIAPPTAEPAASASGFWSRIRSAWLIPGLAVAGSAALVLILLQPTFSDEPEATVAVREEPQAAADAPRPPSPGAAPAEEPTLQPPPAAPEALEPAAEPEPAPDAASAAIGGLERGAPAKSTEQAEEQRERSAKDEGAANAGAKAGWDAVEDGDTARKGGDCFTARNHYARALDDGDDSVRARAYAGMGLCKQHDGDDAAAAEYFQEARQLDPDSVEFADTQTKKRPEPVPRRSRKKASGKKRNSVDFDEAADPLSGM